MLKCAAAANPEMLANWRDALRAWDLDRRRSAWAGQGSTSTISPGSA